MDMKKTMSTFDRMMENPEWKADFEKEAVFMTMTAVSIDVPKNMVEYMVSDDEKTNLIRNAMILFPYIQNDTISHGKAAQILGIHKMDLIALYSNLGLPYLNQTSDELESDVAVLKEFRRNVV